MPPLFSVEALGSSVGESGALPCMGQIRAPRFLGKLLAVYVPEKAGIFLVWQTIVQCIKLQNVTALETIAGMCFANAF